MSCYRGGAGVKPVFEKKQENMVSFIEMMLGMGGEVPIN